MRRRKDIKDFNENWEAEMATYDAACESEEREFRRKHLLFKNSGSSALTDEENEIFDKVLRGIPCDEIAEQYGVEKELITGLIEIIRAKLSLID